MKYLSRGLAASAAALLLSAGLAGPAAAAPPDCEIGVADVSQPEGNTDGTVDVTLTTNDDPACDGVVIDFFTTDGTATEPGDYTETSDSVTLATGTTSYALTVPVKGDTVFEENETFKVTVEDGADAGVTITTATSTVTLTNDDEGVADGGVLTIDPTSGPVGTTITVSGTKCTADTVDVSLGGGNGSMGDTVATKDDVAVADDGSFSTTLTVPNDADPTWTYRVDADCNGELYEGKAFDVTGEMTGANGYRMVAGDGGIFTFGERTFHGSTGAMTLNKPIVGGATDTSDYDGYWIVASDGGVFTFSAPFYGSLGGSNITSPAVEIEPHPTGKGYWIVQADGTVTPYGESKHFGDMKGKALNKPIIGMSVTTTGMGYWLIAEDGGIFNFGDAEFFGSTGDKKLNAPIIDLAPAVDNQGYYLLGRDGGVFTFGSADFKGSTGNMTLNAPVVAMLVNPAGSGYWLAASDGGIFTFGPGVDFLGSMGGTKLNSPVLDLIN